METVARLLVQRLPFRSLPSNRGRPSRLVPARMLLASVRELQVPVLRARRRPKTPKLFCPNPSIPRSQEPRAETSQLQALATTSQVSRCLRFTPEKGAKGHRISNRHSQKSISIGSPAYTRALQCEQAQPDKPRYPT